MSDKPAISGMLVSMGFDASYVKRAFKVYEKNYGNKYNVEVITEIIVRLQNKDREKNAAKANAKSSKNTNNKHRRDSTPPSPRASLEPWVRGPTKPKQARKSGRFRIQRESSPPAAYSHGFADSAHKPSASLNSKQKQKHKSNNYYHSHNNSNNNHNNNSHDNNNRNANPSRPLRQQRMMDRHRADDFVEHMSAAEVRDSLRAGSKVDVRDQVGRYVYGTVVEKASTRLKIHFDGWSRKWDVWVDAVTELAKIARAGSISKRPAHRFQGSAKGDYVDLNPLHRHPGWTVGEIRRLDSKSGQVQVVYEHEEKNYLYWAHLDNPREIAEFTSRTGTNQALQREVEHRLEEPVHPHARYGRFGHEYEYGHGQHSLQQQPAELMNDFGDLNLRTAIRESLMASASASASSDLNAHQNEHQNQNQNNNSNRNTNMDAWYAGAAAADLVSRRQRQRRFPRVPNEKIENTWHVGDCAEIADSSTGHPMRATVVDTENNWIVLHFEGQSVLGDQTLHCVQSRMRLKRISNTRAVVREQDHTQQSTAHSTAHKKKDSTTVYTEDEEFEFEEEMEDFLLEIQGFHFSLVEIVEDGNGLFRCFAHEIFNDERKHALVRQQCCAYITNHEAFFAPFMTGDHDEVYAQMRRRQTAGEWGDHMDIVALSELYNVRVRIFELSVEYRKLYVSLNLPNFSDFDPESNVPMVILARHSQKHYNVIRDPTRKFQRPLGDADQRAALQRQQNTQANKQQISMAELRVLEEEQSGALFQTKSMNNNNNNRSKQKTQSTEVVYWPSNQ